MLALCSDQENAVQRHLTTIVHAQWTVVRMTLFSVEKSKSVNSVLTLYGNRRITRWYSLQNVRSWYVLSGRLTGLYLTT